MNGSVTAIQTLYASTGAMPSRSRLFLTPSWSLSSWIMLSTCTYTCDMCATKELRIRECAIPTWQLLNTRRGNELFTRSCELKAASSSTMFSVAFLYPKNRLTSRRSSRILLACSRAYAARCLGGRQSSVSCCPRMMKIHITERVKLRKIFISHLVSYKLSSRSWWAVS
jgi:hypothetical protein